MLPAARYCRACYTVFGSTAPAPSIARREDSRSWQLLLLLALAGGGWWAWNAETVKGSDPGAWTDAAPAEGGGFGPDRASARSGSSHGQRSAAASADRPARAAASPQAPGQWLLQVDSHRICGSPSGCEVTIRFSSGAAARFAVAPQADALSALVPLGDDGGRLLSRHWRGTLVGERARSVPIVTLGGRRWVAVGAGAES